MILEKESGFSEQAEATLIQQAQAGSQESLNLLLLRHERLVHRVVRRQWIYTLPYAVAVQEGRRGLWQAILGLTQKRQQILDLRLPGNYEVCLGGLKGEIRRIGGKYHGSIGVVLL